MIIIINATNSIQLLNNFWWMFAESSGWEPLHFQNNDGHFVN